jgi:hypothetical protein
MRNNDLTFLTRLFAEAVAPRARIGLGLASGGETEAARMMTIYL